MASKKRTREEDQTEAVADKRLYKWDNFGKNLAERRLLDALYTAFDQFPNELMRLIREYICYTGDGEWLLKIHISHNTDQILFGSDIDHRLAVLNPEPHSGVLFDYDLDVGLLTGSFPIDVALGSIDPLEKKMFLHLECHGTVCERMIGSNGTDFFFLGLDVYGSCDPTWQVFRSTGDNCFGGRIAITQTTDKSIQIHAVRFPRPFYEQCMANVAFPSDQCPWTTLSDLTGMAYKVHRIALSRGTRCTCGHHKHFLFV
jgi:hypothetical protein